MPGRRLKTRPLQRHPRLHHRPVALQTRLGQNSAAVKLDVVPRAALARRQLESNPCIGVPAAPVKYPRVLSCTGFRVFESRLVPSNPGEFCGIR